MIILKSLAYDKRRVLVASTAIQTIDDEMIIKLNEACHLIIYWLTRDQNATYNLGLPVEKVKPVCKQAVRLHFELIYFLKHDDNTIYVRYAPR